MVALAAASGTAENYTGGTIVSSGTLDLTAVPGPTAKLPASLELVPENVAFYSAALRNREKYEAIVNSRAWAKLKGLPVVQRSSRPCTTCRRPTPTASPAASRPPCKTRKSKRPCRWPATSSRTRSSATAIRTWSISWICSQRVIGAMARPGDHAAQRQSAGHFADQLQGDGRALGVGRERRTAESSRPGRGLQGPRRCGREGAIGVDRAAGGHGPRRQPAVEDAFERRPRSAASST